MSDTWSSDAERFNKVHAPAGSAAGGQFAPASGSSSAGGKAAGGGKAAHPRSTPSNQHPVGRGETGKRVSDLQERLNTLGFKPALKVDGIFGPKTLAAVKAFQVSHGLKVDGLVGPLTTAALRARPKAKAAQHGTARPSAHVTAPKTAPAKTARRGSDLKYGHGSALWDYWTRGAGFAKWSGAAHKWTTLHALLLKAGVPPASADGLTTNIITAVMPGYMKQAHAGRAAMTADTKAKPYGDVTYADPRNGKYPLDTEARCRAAWSYINMPKNAAMYPMNGVTLSEVKDRIKAALKKYGADVSSDSSASRTEPVYFRTYELEDIHIVRAAQGDSTGRLVEAYATAFNAPAEIQDFEGHYIEEIDPAAFNKVLSDLSRSRAGFGKVKVMYNHGMTIHGTPSERGSMPIATPVDIRPEARGLLTLARYSDTPFADEVLENIRNGSITAQSFTGRIVRSDPQLRRGERHRPRGDQLTRVRRIELGLKEFGPTPFEAYSGAEIVGVRMSTPGTWEPDEEHEEHEDEALLPDGEAAAGEPLTRADDGDGDEHSARYHQNRLYVLRSKEKREAAGLVW